MAVVDVKTEFEQMVGELKDQSNDEFYKLNVLTDEAPFIFAGIDAGNLNRMLYIDLGQSPWEDEQLNALPKWRGLSIKMEYFEKIFSLKNRHVLIIRQEDEQN